MDTVFAAGLRHAGLCFLMRLVSHTSMNLKDSTWMGCGTCLISGCQSKGVGQKSKAYRQQRKNRQRQGDLLCILVNQSMCFLVRYVCLIPGQICLTVSIRVK